MRTQKIAPIPLLLTLFGLAAGIGATSISMQETDFPVDMIIYREGVQAFFGGRDVYAVPMYAGDLALPFIYPPFGAVALWPLSSTSLPHSVAGDIMIGVSAALLLLCLFFVFRAVGVAREWLWPVTAAAWAVGMLIEPVTLNNGFAQINIVLMALVILDLVPRRRWLPQGWLIGLAIAIKISPAAMLLYFLLKKKNLAHRDCRRYRSCGHPALSAGQLGRIRHFLQNHAPGHGRERGLWRRPLLFVK